MSGRRLVWITSWNISLRPKSPCISLAVAESRVDFCSNGFFGCCWIDFLYKVYIFTVSLKPSLLPFLLWGQLTLWVLGHLHLYLSCVKETLHDDKMCSRIIARRTPKPYFNKDEYKKELSHNESFYVCNIVKVIKWLSSMTDKHQGFCKINIISLTSTFLLIFMRHNKTSTLQRQRKQVKNCWNVQYCASDKKNLGI